MNQHCVGGEQRTEILRVSNLRRFEDCLTYLIYTSDSHRLVRIITCPISKTASFPSTIFYFHLFSDGHIFLLSCGTHAVGYVELAPPKTPGLWLASGGAPRNFVPTPPLSIRSGVPLPSSLTSALCPLLRSAFHASHHASTVSTTCPRLHCSVAPATFLAHPSQER